MGYKKIKLDPTQCTFCFRLDEHDCYELRKGICSLYLSDEEAESISQQEMNQQLGESNVMYCRNLASQLLSIDYFNKVSFQDDIYSIRMHERDCGHYVFTDGQHRTCISKHLNVESMFVNLEDYPRDFSLFCEACYEKWEAEKENKKISNKILSLFKKNKKKQRPGEFIDDEHMKFQKRFTE